VSSIGAWGGGWQGGGAAGETPRPSEPHRGTRRHDQHEGKLHTYVII
jgi:hypothetical protein